MSKDVLVVVIIYIQRLILYVCLTERIASCSCCLLVIELYMTC